MERKKQKAKSGALFDYLREEIIKQQSKNPSVFDNLPSLQSAAKKMVGETKPSSNMDALRDTSKVVLIIDGKKHPVKMGDDGKGNTAFLVELPYQKFKEVSVLLDGNEIPLNHDKELNACKGAMLTDKDTATFYLMEKEGNLQFMGAIIPLDKEGE